MHYEPRNEDTNLVRAFPALMRIAASAWLRTAEWTVGAYFRATSRVVRAARNGESPADLFEEGGAELREYLRRLLGVMEMDGAGPSAERPPEEASDTASLREQGAELLRR